VVQIPYHQPNLAHVAMHRINIFIATTAVNNPNYSAKFVHRLFNPIIVLKDRSNPNTFVHTASTPYSVGNLVAM
jgi:hypothetical protein